MPDLIGVKNLLKGNGHQGNLRLFNKAALAGGHCIVAQGLFSNGFFVQYDFSVYIIKADPFPAVSLPECYLLLL